MQEQIVVVSNESRRDGKQRWRGSAHFEGDKKQTLAAHL